MAAVDPGIQPVPQTRESIGQWPSYSAQPTDRQPMQQPVQPMQPSGLQQVQNASLPPSQVPGNAHTEANYGQPTIGSYGNRGQQNTKISFMSMAPKYGSIGAAATARMFIAPFRGSRGASSYRRDVYYAALRSSYAAFDPYHLQHRMIPTDKALEKVSQENMHVLESIPLGEGAVGHWLYKSNAKYVMLFFHGGGYIQPMSVGHAKYLFGLQRKINRMGYEFSIFAIQYTLAPEASYPTQLRQAVAALNFLTERQNRKPKHIMIGGDASGGNLAAALLLHIANPHPNVEPVHLESPLRGALLISPWVSFDLNAPSFKKNRYSDYMPVKAFEQASRAYLGPQGNLDEYTEPLRAPVEWWQRVATKVGEIMIWGGGSEVLIDGIREFAVRVEIGFEREQQERGPGRSRAATDVRSHADGDKDRDLFEEGSDDSKSPATPRAPEDFNFGFNKRAGFVESVQSPDTKTNHPAFRGQTNQPLVPVISKSTAEDLHVIDEVEATGAGLHAPEDEESKKKRVSMAVEEDDYLNVPSLYPNQINRPYDTTHMDAHPLEEVMSPSTAEDIHIIDAVLPHDDPALQPGVDSKLKRQSMAAKEEDDYLHVPATTIPPELQPPPILPVLAVEDTESPGTAQDVNLINDIIHDAEAENVADRASLSDYGDHGPLPGDGKAGARHSWGIHRLSGAHLAAPGAAGAGGAAHHHLRRSMAEKEEDDYVHVPTYTGPTTPPKGEHEWPGQHSQQRVKYVETPRMAHEEMIIDYVLKFGGKREGARSIERWFEAVLGPDKLRASMMPRMPGEEERRRYLRGEDVGLKPVMVEGAHAPALPTVPE